MNTPILPADTNAGLDPQANDPGRDAWTLGPPGLLRVETLNGRTVWVNPAHVVLVADESGSARLSLLGGDLLVAEDAPSLAERLSGVLAGTPAGGERR